MPYEFNGLYLFGTPLPMVDDEVVVSPAQNAALQRAVAEMMATAYEPKPATDATAS
jgi:hypothetical protein